MAPKPQRPRLPSRKCWHWVFRSARELTRHEWEPTILGSHSIGSLPERRWVERSFIQRKTVWIGQKRCAFIRTAARGFPARKISKELSRLENWPTSPCSPPTILRNVYRLLHTVIVNFLGMMSNAIFLPFIFLSELLFKPTEHCNRSHWFFHCIFAKRLGVNFASLYV